jgi:transcriptional regulator with XRE-family HTH domain
MGITERVNLVVRHYGLNNNSFAGRLGINAATTHGILSGRSKPSFDILEKIAQTFTEVNESWLLTGKGSMLKEEMVPVSQHREVLSKVEKLERTVLDFIMGKPNPDSEQSAVGTAWPFFMPCVNTSLSGGQSRMATS